MKDKDILERASWGFKRESQEIPAYEIPPNPDFEREIFSASTDTSIQEENFIDEILVPEEPDGFEEIDVILCQNGEPVEGKILFKADE